jgi:acetylornithine/succinyldiaminopimelate/putrescine aminotransferase
MLTEQIRSNEDRYQLKTYAKMPLSIERGEGCYVFDEAGRRYLDFYGGHAVVATGHCHPRVVQALKEQAEKLIFYSNVAYNGARSEAARKLIELAGPPYYQVFLANSGSEANENAIKLARALTGRTEIISLIGSFHGRTYGALSSTGLSKYSSYLNTPVPDHRVVPAEEAAAAISDRTAGVLIEPIQSLGGVREIPLKLLNQIQDACRLRGSLLIYDEVQTGVGRTGTFLFAGQGGVFPDMVTLAKGIASGFPAGALLVTEATAGKVKIGDLGTTFGGGPLACACIGATLDVIDSERLVSNAARMGEYLRERLMGVGIVSEIRGRGLLVGLKMGGAFDKAKPVQEGLFARGVLTGTSDDPTVLRLMPPLVVSREQVDFFMEQLLSL